MIRYVTDTRAIYSLDGLRVVKKYDYTTGTSAEFRGGIEVIYKSTKMMVEYTTKGERDDTFSQIAAALAERNKEGR